MDIFVLSLVAGLIALGGLWVASRETKPVDKHEDFQRNAV